MIERNFFCRYFTENAVLKKVPSCFLLLGGCYAALQLIGCLMLADPPHQVRICPHFYIDNNKVK